MEYMSITQAAEKWDITPLRIQALCKEERVPGVIRIGYVWVIPADAEKLKDARVRSGKYVKATQEKRGYNKKEKTHALLIFDVVILESDLPHELKEAINAEGVLLYEKLKLR